MMMVGFIMNYERVFVLPGTHPSVVTNRNLFQLAGRKGLTIPLCGSAALFLMRMAETYLMEKWRT